MRTSIEFSVGLVFFLRISGEFRDALFFFLRTSVEFCEARFFVRILTECRRVLDVICVFQSNIMAA